MQTEPGNAVTELLRDAYGLDGATLDRLPVGQVTVNYRAQTDDTTLFVKQYMEGADLREEAEAIAMTRRAGASGVPVAQVVTSRAGEAISSHGQTAVSVWEWVHGRTVADGLNFHQQREAGRALGKIHRAFADHPASRARAGKLDRWMSPDLSKIESTIDRIFSVIDSRPEPDVFDLQARQTLTERRVMLQHLPGLIEGLPTLTTQVLHGDYSAVNLLFSGDQLTAALDFRPPEPFLIAYELGRIAFDPRAVVYSDDWMAAGTNLTGAYLEENPQVSEGDVRFCARAAVIQLVVSLYGVKEHYLKPGLIQDDLDAFWSLRHQAAKKIMDGLPDIELRLSRIAA